MQQIETIRARAKDRFPAVLLTLLSIIQALALELLWSGLGDHPHLWAGGLPAVIGWLQVAGVVMGIVVVWLFYTSLVMRLVWVPSMRDSIIPFVLGICEFILAEMLAPEQLHLWIFLLAAIFAFSNWTSMSTFRRAKLDPDNSEFFRDFEEYTPVSHILPAAFVLSLVVSSGAVYIWGPHGVSGLLGVGLVLALLFAQVGIIRHYWVRSTTWVSAPSTAERAQRSEPESQAKEGASGTGRPRGA